MRLRYLDREPLTDKENALLIVFSPNGSAPFTPLPSVVNPLDITIGANITQAGFFLIGQREQPPLIFADGFEQGADRVSTSVNRRLARSLMDPAGDWNAQRFPLMGESIDHAGRSCLPIHASSGVAWRRRPR